MIRDSTSSLLQRDFPYLISDFSFAIACNGSDRLESGLVRLRGRGTSALSKQSDWDTPYQWQMKNVKLEMEDSLLFPVGGSSALRIESLSCVH